MCQCGVQRFRACESSCQVAVLRLLPPHPASFRVPLGAYHSPLESACKLQDVTPNGLALYAGQASQM